MSKELDNFKSAMQTALQSVMLLENSNNQLRDLNRGYKAHIVNLQDDYAALSKSDQTADLRDQLAIMTARAQTAEAQLEAMRKLLGITNQATAYGTGAGEFVADGSAMVEHSK